MRDEAAGAARAAAGAGEGTGAGAEEEWRREQQKQQKLVQEFKKGTKRAQWLTFTVLL